MNNNEFIAEIKKSDYYSDDLMTTLDHFTKYQDLTKAALRNFCQICNEYKVEYQLAYGSLLGVVRDGGQIPWDYDVDVFVPCYERDRLLDLLSKHLDNSFYLASIETDKDCEHVITRIAPVGYDSKYLHVDIFYVMGCPVEDKTKIVKRVYDLTLLYKAKKFDMKNPGIVGKQEFIRMIFYRIRGLFLNSNKILEDYFTLTNQYPVNQYDFSISADRFSGWYLFPSELFTETKKIHSIFGDVFIPSDYEKMLTIIYGDYNTIPPLESRVKEVIRHYNYLKNSCPIKKQN